MNKTETSQNESIVFNYKDYTYMRMAILACIEKLSLIDEGDTEVAEERFAQAQDDIQYLERIRDIIQRKIESLQSPPHK